MFVFFFNDTATTEIYTLSLHVALPISKRIQQISGEVLQVQQGSLYPALHRLEQQAWIKAKWKETETRSEEHTSELQSRLHIVCRLLLDNRCYCWRYCFCSCWCSHVYIG